MPLVEKRLSDADAPGIIIQSVSTDLGITMENATSKQDTPALGAMESDTSEISIPKASECEGVPEKSGMEEETIPEIKPRGRGRPRKERKPSRRGRPRKDGKPRDFSLKETIPQATKCEGVNRRGRPRKNTLIKTITEKCLPDTRLSRLTREMKRRTPGGCELEIAQPFDLSNLKRQRFTETDTLGQTVSSDFGISSENVAPKQGTVEEDTSKIQAASEPFAIGNVQLGNDTSKKTITLGLVMQSVSSDLGIASENIVSQQTIVKTFTHEEDTTKTQASKPTSPDSFAVETVQLENGISKKPITKESECKNLPQNCFTLEEIVPKADKYKEATLKGRPRKEKAPKASKCKEVRPRGRPRNETVPKSSESKKVGSRGRPRKDTISKASENKKVTRQVCLSNATIKKSKPSKEAKPRGRIRKENIPKAGQSKNVAPLTHSRKKLKHKVYSKYINYERKKIARRLKMAEQRRNPEYCARERLREKERYELKKDLERLAKLFDEADEKAENVHRTPMTSDCTAAPDNASQNLNPDKSTRASRKKVKIPIVIHYRPKPKYRRKVKPSIKQCKKCGLIKSNHGIYCLVCQKQLENPTENPHTKETPNPVNRRKAKPRKKVKPSKKKCLKCGLIKSNSDTHCVVCQRQFDNPTENPPTTEFTGPTLNRFESTPSQIGKPYFLVECQNNSIIDDYAIFPFLRSSNGTICSDQIKTQSQLDYDASYAQLCNKDEAPFLQNSSDLISAFIQIKPKPESNDDAITSYLLSSNEAIDAIQIKTEPPPENDPICAQLWNRYETVPLSQDSSELISAYIKVKTEPESNDAELQCAMDLANATTVG